MEEEDSPENDNIKKEINVGSLSLASATVPVANAKSDSLDEDSPEDDNTKEEIKLGSSSLGVSTTTPAVPLQPLASQTPAAKVQIIFPQNLREASDKAKAAASLLTPATPTSTAIPDILKLVPVAGAVPPAPAAEPTATPVTPAKSADAAKPQENRNLSMEFAVSIPTTARAAAMLNCTANSNELAKQYSSALDAANQVIGAATAASTDDAEKEALYGVLQGLEGPLPLVKDVDFTKKDSVDAATNKTLAIMLGVEKYKDEGKDKADKIEKTLEEIDKEAAEKLEKAGIKDQAAQQQLANLVKARMVCNRTKGIELNKAADVDDDLRRLKFQDELAELAKKGGQAVDLSKKKTPEERLKDLNVAVKDGTAKQIKDGLYAQIGPDGKPVYSMTTVNKENIDEVVKSLSHEREIIWSNIPSGQKKVAELACLKNWQQASFEDTRSTRLGERAGDFVVQTDPRMMPLSKTLPECLGDWASIQRSINWQLAA